VSVNRIVILADDPDEAWEDAAPYLLKLFRVYAKIGLIPNADALFGPQVEALEALKDLVRGICLVGSPETVAPTLVSYASYGVTQLQLRPAPAFMPTELVERTVRLAGENLVPTFN
jgi:alkanesulfonate monooxygenase SsuD/methylene tetrahydromethanopterin reductase-like flavin-dependent oxidoreductase (luciferase family)